MEEKNSENNRYKYVGKRVEEIREAFGMTKVDLASSSKCSEPTVRYLENGNIGQAGLSIILWLAKEKNINPSWLLLEDNSTVPKYLSSYGSDEVKIELEEKLNLLEKEFKLLALKYDRIEQNIIELANIFSDFSSKFSQISFSNTRIITTPSIEKSIEDPDLTSALPYNEKDS